MRGIGWSGGQGSVRTTGRCSIALGADGRARELTMSRAASVASLPLHSPRNTGRRRNVGGHLNHRIARPSVPRRDTAYPSISADCSPDIAVPCIVHVARTRIVQGSRPSVLWQDVPWFCDGHFGCIVATAGCGGPARPNVEFG